MRRLPLTALALALLAGFGGAAALALRPGAAAAPPPRRPLLRLDSTLPAWVAPGGAVSLTGFAGARKPVQVATAAGEVLTAAMSGPRGRFRLRFRAPGRAGRYDLRLLAPGVSTPIGRLLVRPLTLDAVGDITFGEQVGPTIAARGPAYPWTGVAPTLRRADVTVGNLETAVSARGTAEAGKRYVFRGTPASLRPVGALAGFDVLTLANNHSGDYGPAALLDTLAATRAAGIASVGAGSDETAARRPAILRAGGLHVAVLGYSDVNPLGFPAGAGTPGTARAGPAAIAADVRAARRRADVVVCFLHWGVEMRVDPDARQRALADACLGAGGDVVLGAHPHVLGAVERPGPRTLVSWTLGNFVFPSSGVAADTAILQVRLGADGVRGYRLLPVRIDGFRPELVRAGTP